MTSQKEDSKIKNFIARKELYKNANKLQKKMKKQEKEMDFMLQRLEEMDAPKGKEIIMEKYAKQKEEQ